MKTCPIDHSQCMRPECACRCALANETILLPPEACGDLFAVRALDHFATPEAQEMEGFGHA